MTLSHYPTAALTVMRREKDTAFKDSNESPLTMNQRAAFDGLRYFPIDPTLAFDIEPEIFDEADQSLQRIMTSTNEIRHYMQVARLSFTVGGAAVSLVLYQDQDGENYFLPFADSTNGQETYGAGRYVEIEPLENGLVRVDFNQAYNPYCAYNDAWSCPYVPADNRLSVPIRAGELTPPDTWTGHS